MKIINFFSKIVLFVYPFLHSSLSLTVSRPFVPEPKYTRGWMDAPDIFMHVANLGPLLRCMLRGTRTLHARLVPCTTI